MVVAQRSSKPEEEAAAGHGYADRSAQKTSQMPQG